MASAGMRRAPTLAVLTVLLGAVPFTWAQPSRAAEPVTYEIVSDTIAVADVEYMDRSGRMFIGSVPLPWRLDVALDDPAGPTGQGAQLRADWRPTRAAARWVTVRIFHGSELLCQSTLDVGNVTCYGNTPHFS